MRNRIISLTTLVLTVFMGVGFALAPASALTLHTTASTALQGDACQGLSALGGQTCGKSSDNVVGNLATTVVNILSVIVGIASVIMIIIAGLKYITSGGDSNSISSAKNTLIYALVGLVVAGLAQFLVHFVLNKL